MTMTNDSMIFPQITTAPLLDWQLILDDVHHQAKEAFQNEESQETQH
jgi:hypothetical protein